MGINQWYDFFVMVGGGAAALTGLVFVAMSINLSIIAQDATHKNRAVATLTGFAAVFMICAFALIANQSNQWIGTEWLFFALFAVITYIRKYTQAKNMGRSSVGLSTGRFIAGTSCYAIQILGSVLLMSGYVAGLYVASVALVLTFGFLISGAWLLITGISENQVT